MHFVCLYFTKGVTLKHWAGAYGRICLWNMSNSKSSKSVETVKRVTFSIGLQDIQQNEEIFSFQASCPEIVLCLTGKAKNQENVWLSVCTGTVLSYIDYIGFMAVYTCNDFTDACRKESFVYSTTLRMFLVRNFMCKLQVMRICCKELAPQKKYMYE